MAGGQERILRRRIKSVESTKKITRAMELIAATRVVKAQDRSAAARPYAEMITSVILDLVKVGAAKEHPLLQRHEQARSEAIVCISSDRGLCGAYNSTIIRLTEREIDARRAEGRDFTLFVVGKKAQSYFRFRGFPMDHVFLDVTDQPTYDQAKQISDALRPRYEAGEFENAQLIYWRFLSAGAQQAVVRRFLPLEVEEDDPTARELSADLEYEPSPTGILNELLPRYVEARIYSALLDASASEHAARQRAMKSATDNAEELKITLTRVMNRARQDSITTEIMEIVGGAEALAQGKGSKEDLLVDHLMPPHAFPENLDRTDHTSAHH
ncbi:MAG: F0F1 ATP synthase subunit gamma [Acidimicrobiia bacterium]|nr:F0F1 ATP synthase subunit gamma [Acidimicrobiia bacterium]